MTNSTDKSTVDKKPIETADKEAESSKSSSFLNKLGIGNKPGLENRESIDPDSELNTMAAKTEDASKGKSANGIRRFLSRQRPLSRIVTVDKVIEKIVEVPVDRIVEVEKIVEKTSRSHCR